MKNIASRNDTNELARYRFLDREERRVFIGHQRCGAFDRIARHETIGKRSHDGIDGFVPFAIRKRGSKIREISQTDESPLFANGNCEFPTRTARSAITCVADRALRRPNG